MTKHKDTPLDNYLDRADGINYCLLILLTIVVALDYLNSFALPLIILFWGNTIIFSIIRIP